MAFPTLAGYRVYVSPDNTPDSYIPLIGTIDWDFTNDSEGEPISYMGGTVGSASRARSVQIGGLVDFADPGQNLVRARAESGAVMYIALVHSFTSLAVLEGRRAETTVRTHTDTVNVDGEDRPRFTMTFALTEAPTTITSLPTT